MGREIMSHLTRRSLLAGAAGIVGAAATARGALAQSAAPAAPKGSLVWLDLDQAALDKAYDQAPWAPNAAYLGKRRVALSEQTRQRLGAPRRLSYGSAAIEALDLFPTKRPNAPINVYIHGGAWRAGMAKDAAYFAELFVNAGAHYIALDFNNVLELNGDLMPMARQVRAGIAWVYKNAASFGGDPNRIYVSGHSSGGHLAGTTLITDWQKDFGVPDNVIKGALLSSGMYDLKPVRLSARSNYVRFTDEMEHALSTQRHLAKISCPVVCTYGTLETPEFQRQSRDFAAAMKAAGKPVELLVGPEYNHFEIMDTLASPYGLCGRAVLQQMKLTTV
jgi:arylformamidase